MNKKEMLALLESIRGKITDSNIDEYSIDDKVAILEEVMRLRERTERDIKYLQEKLSNDDNYLDKTPYLYDESRRFNLEEHLAICQKEEEENNQNIQRHEELIAQMERNLPAQEEVSRHVIEELNEEIADMEADLRDSLDMTDKDFETLRNTLSDLRILREAHRENIESGRKAIENLKAKVQDLKDQEIGFIEARDQAVEILANFDKSVANRPRIDMEAKRADQRRLMVYTAELRSYEVNERIASFDYSREINEIIDDYKNDRIDDQEVIEKIKQYKNYIIDEFLTDDMTARETNPEIAQLDQAEISCVSEIARLEKKLSNDENYAVSTFMIEKRDRQLKRLRERITSIDNQIDAYNNEITAMQVDIETSEYMISELESEKREMEKTIRRAGASIDPDFEKDILTRIANRTTDIEYLQSVKLDCSRTMEHDANELGLLESKDARYHEIYERLEKNYKKRNQYDTVTRRLDEQELAKMRDSLAAIKNRRTAISVSIYDDLESIINAEFAPKAEQSKVGESKPEDLKSEESPTQEENEITPEEQENIDEVLSEMEPFDKKQEDPTDKKDDTLLDPEKDNLDPIGLGDTRGHKAKYSENENETLTRKAKKVGFIHKLKKWFKIVIMVATIGLVLLGLKRCSQTDLENYMKDAQQNPTRYENMTETEIQDDIDEQIGLPTQTENEQQKQDKETQPIAEEAELKEETLGTVEEEKNVAEEETAQLLPLDDIAKEVIRGRWGNGQERYDRLREAGYDVKEVQHRVNEMVAEAEKEENIKKAAEDQEKDGQAKEQDEQQADKKEEDQKVEVDTTDGISIEEQEQILKDQGIEISEDVAPVTTEEAPIYDFDVNDESAYGGFTESSQTSGTSSSESTSGGTASETNTTTEEIPQVNDDWGEFHETGTVTSNDSSQNLNLMSMDSTSETVEVADPNVVKIAVNNGESYVYNAGDGTIYELNNGANTNVEGASSFVEMEDTESLTQDSNGTVTLQVGGQTAASMEREKPLTADELQKLREELAAKFGGDVVTQEDVNDANDDYQRSR